MEGEKHAYFACDFASRDVGLRQPVTTRMANKTPDWVKTLRKSFKLQAGKGWTIRPIAGNIQINVRFTDNTTSSVVTDLPWVGSSQEHLIPLAGKMKSHIEDGKTAKQAYDLANVAEANKTEAGATNWALIAQKFEDYKQSSGEVSARTWHRNWRLRIARALDILEGKPRPTSGKSLLEAVVAKHFPNGKGAGSTDRRLAIQYIAAFLKWAVEEQGVDSRWLVPNNLKTYIGVKGKGQTLTTYISDGQIRRLLAGIDDSKWRTAVAFVACFGLRPVELHTISTDGTLLHVGWQKRTARKPQGTDERDVPALDPVGLEGLGADLLAQLAERGLGCLPAACHHERCGDRLAKYLERQPVWQLLVEEVKAIPAKGRTGNDLVPYSLRHAYSARAEEVYGISDRRAALHMGHSVQTHNSHYSGTGADSEDRTLEQVAAVQAANKIKALEALV